MEPKMKNPEEETFDWLQVQKEIEFSNSFEEGTKEKFIRKCQENPLVPLGCILTVGCLSYGIYSFRQGERIMSQRMMRARILAQGFTVAALVGGVLMSAIKEKDNIKK